jgi:peptide/nickel transport system ATP-binding protein
VRDIVAEPLVIWKIGSKEERIDKANAMLDSVGIDPYISGGRRPREFSGGQCQRISIARALVLQPQLLVCDEIVSALDVSVQAQILNLLDDLKRDRGLTMLFIAHDLAVVKNVSDRVAVMYLGKLCEVARPDDLYHRPEHPYTEALLTSIPEPDPGASANGKATLTGDLPSPINPPSGCRFRTRCPFAQQKCADEEPQMRAIGPDHFVACHFPLGSQPSTAFATSASTQPPVAPAAPDSQQPPAWSVQAPDPTPFTPVSSPPTPPAPTPPPPSSPPERTPERSPLWIDPR